MTIMDELARRLATGPATFPHQLDAARDLLLLVQLEEAELAQASFLDERLLSAKTRGHWVPVEDVRSRLGSEARDDAHYIFHIGHVGSTLVSRLLGALPDVLALREPLLLRTLAAAIGRRENVDAPWNPTDLSARVRLGRQLLARTFRPEQRAIIKATSFTSEIAPDLVVSGSRALFLSVAPESYAATILAGENSRRELADTTGPRLERLAKRAAGMPFRLWSLSEGERIMLGWATEMAALRAAADALPSEDILWMDFDAFLADPPSNLRRIAAHFGFALDEGAATAIVASSIMQRYSKAPEHVYGPELRSANLADAARTHSLQIREGMRWLDRFYQHYPALARIRDATRK